MKCNFISEMSANVFKGIVLQFYETKIFTLGIEGGNLTQCFLASVSSGPFAPLLRIITS